MTDTPIETVEFDDIPDDLSDLGEAQEKRPYRTLLEIWRAILEPAVAGEMRKDPISPQWATKMVTTYPEVRFSDVDAIHNGVFDMAAEMARILDDEIADDDEALKKASVEEDAQENSEHYRNILAGWQIHIMQEELAWRPGDSDASIRLATLSEVQQMFLGQTGLVAHLDSINFQFTEDDSAELQQRLEDAKAEALGLTGGDGE